jgi:hypothetical protein
MPGQEVDQRNRTVRLRVMSPDGKPALSAPPDSKKESEAGQEREQRTPPVSKSPSLFSLCYLLLEKMI